jgi:lipopolysaccharide export system permease protein
VAVTGVLLVILLSNQLARVLSQAAANEFPRSTVLALLGLTSLQNLTIVLPVGLFLGVMLALGRLYHESEMAAIESCGVGPGGLYRPVMAVAVFVVALLTWIAFSASPQAARYAQAIRVDAMKAAQFGQLAPGRFRSFSGGDIVFYAERVDENGILYNVFVERSDGPKLEIVTATRAEQRNAGEAEQVFVLYEGERYEGIPGQGDFRIMRFSEHGIPIRLPAPSSGRNRREMKASGALFASTDPKDQAELQWRISIPIMATVLTILAVPLARLRPRQGRYGKMGLAILIYFLYSNVLAAARVWVERNTVPDIVGVWWVHLLALALTAWILARNSGWRPLRLRASTA